MYHIKTAFWRFGLLVAIGLVLLVAGLVFYLLSLPTGLFLR